MIYLFYSFIYHKNSERYSRILYLRKMAQEYVNTLRRYYNAIPLNRKYFVNSIIDRFNPKMIKENNYIKAVMHNETSYLLNKDQELKICLMKNKKEIHDNNILLYVLIHEMTHMGSIEIGHNDEFISNFKWFLTFLTDMGKYIPYDFSKNPILYCGKIYVSENQYYV